MTEVALASLCSSWSTTLSTRITTVVQIVRDADSAIAHMDRYLEVVGICANPEPKVVRTVCGANTFARHRLWWSLSMVCDCCRCGGPCTRPLVLSWMKGVPHGARTSFGSSQRAPRICTSSVLQCGCAPLEYHFLRHVHRHHVSKHNLISCQTCRVLYYHRLLYFCKHSQ